MPLSPQGRRHRPRPSIIVVWLIPLLVAACGNGPPSDDADGCLADTDCPESAQQAALDGDRQAIQRYGNDQSSYSSVQFDKEGTRVVLVAYFADKLSQHRTALEELVQHSDRLRVRASERTRRELERIRDEIRQRLSNTSGWSVGLGVDQVLVTLPPGQEQLADQLRGQFGDSISVSIKLPPRPVGDG